MKSLAKAILCLLLGFSMTACIQDAELTAPDDNSQVDVQFVVGTPGSAIPSTRTLTNGTAASGDENTIDNIFVLMFNSSGNYAGYAAGGSISQGASGNNFRTKTFKARLKRSTSTTDTYTFVFIANIPETKISALTTGTAKATAVASLLASESEIHTNATTSKYLPMWGEYTTATEVKKGVSVTGVNLLRMVASIDVKITASNYRIKTVYLYNRNTNGRVSPDAANVTSNIATAPTTPTSRGYTANSYKQAKDNAATTSYAGEIYTFESKYADNKHCLVVELEKYSASAWSSCGFYRLDFKNGTKDLDLLRNHKYTFTISNVISDGDGTHGGAYTNASTGVTATVVQWNEGLGGTTVVGTEGYYLTVSQSEFEFPSDANTAPADAASQLLINTNYSSGWTAAWYATEANAQSQTSAVTTPFRLVAKSGSTASNTGTGGAIADRYIYRTANSGSARTQYLRINAGELSVIIKVTQTNIAGLTVTPATATATAAGGNIAVSVTAHSGWTATSNLSGATLSQAKGGSGTTPITLSIPANIGSTQRTITFTFESIDGIHTKTVVVTQQAVTIKGAWSKTPVTNKGGSYLGMSFSINVTSNGGTWVPLITVNGTEYEGSTTYFSAASGSGNGTITFTMPPMINGQMTDNSFTSIRFRDVATGITSTALSGTVTQYYPGAIATPSIISIDNTGALRCDGVGWAVFFKWGSTVALTGRLTNLTTNDFYADQVAWAPTTSIMNSIKNDIETKTSGYSFELVPYATHDTYPTELPASSPTSNLGDPCNFIPSTGGVLPNATSATLQNKFKMADGDRTTYDGVAYTSSSVAWHTASDNYGNWGVTGLRSLVDGWFAPAGGILEKRTGRLDYLGKRTEIIANGPVYLDTVNNTWRRPGIDLYQGTYFNVGGLPEGYGYLVRCVNK